MPNTWNVLIASGCLENRKQLIHILDGLPVNVFVAHNIDEALEVLAKQDMDFIFCEALLSDGTYRDLLPAPEHARIPVIAMAHSWDREAHQDAVSHGAFDTLRCPLQPTDVELAVIRAAREHEQEEITDGEALWERRARPSAHAAHA